MRVMPKDRIKFASSGGKNEAFWWRTGKEKIARNELAEALKCFQNGLKIDPTNVFCRFSHGMMCFKLGLILEAKNDYQMVSSLYPKEILAHFNLAICLN